jgi:hypothetical protein
MSEGIRRVVTGLDEQGRSTILFDDRVPLGGTNIIWQTPAIPVDNAGREGAVELGAGDCIVDRGVVHGWQVLGDESVIMTNVLVPSIPVGAGSTI